jgi:DNA-binding response OmpR family regulator
MSPRSSNSSERLTSHPTTQVDQHAATPPAQAVATILLIDDDHAVRESLRRVLAAEMFEVVTAAGGKDALESLQERIPDLIVMDLCMAPLTGWDLMVHLRDRHPTVPIFVVTAVPSKSAGGADQIATRYFQKPVDIAALLTAIRSHLDRPPSEKPRREKMRTRG